MPWSQTSPMDQRTQFIADFLRQVLSVTELCELYGVSRKTAYKWIDRYLRQGPAGLEERSRRPHDSPNRTDEAIVAALLEVRRRHPSWGGKKLLALVHKRHRNWDLPHRSTVCDILSRHGMVPKKRSRRHIGHPGKPTSSILAPNDLWNADFKGQFKTGNGHYCYPLPVADGFSRYSRWAARGSIRPRWRNQSRCSRSCSGSTACPSAFAPTTACPSPPTPWHGYRGSRPGGCAWGSCPN